MVFVKDHRKKPPEAAFSLKLNAMDELREDPLLEDLPHLF
jgi:hypothetical protein